MAEGVLGGLLGGEGKGEGEASAEARATAEAYAAVLAAGAAKNDPAVPRTAESFLQEQSLLLKERREDLAYGLTGRAPNALGTMACASALTCPSSTWPAASANKNAAA